jgi:SLOG in TRPM, prokaryote
MMRTQNIYFPEQQTLCVFPGERSDLEESISGLGLEDNHPVIVLIGGNIDEQQADATRRAIQTISRLAEDMNAVVICGGTDMGVMAEIGQIRWQNRYKFPLVGITPEELVAWPGGPRSTKFLWWGKQRWQLEPHYSHFILVPGSQFGDESPWIVDAATILSKGHRSVTILINGGEVSRKDIELSLENGRPVIAVSRTGRLADELARQPERNNLITVLPANAEKSIAEAVQVALSMNKRVSVTPMDMHEKAISAT